ncbi:uncharacterized protein [Haliotis asinina]|uniref:uncharacterized protein n=1 Tax=Haliotis asinina TaxID=109174 RepID=UPI003531AF8F
MSGKRAPSCHLVFDDHRKGDILMHDVHVPGHGVTMYTYYCCMQWNTCMNGGGYCGIQEHPNGQCYIFSIWDPMTTKEAITHVYKHPGTKVENFGGEGTGLKSMNFDIGWKADQWYTLVTRRWDYRGHSYFGFWVRNHSGDKWEHVVTMDFPVPDIWFQTNTKSFLEDWRGNGEKYRRVHFQNGYKRRDDKSWHPFAHAKFHVHQEKACEMYNDNYDGGRHCDGFFMQSGCGTTPCSELMRGRDVCCGKVASPEPCNAPISFTASASAEQVTWVVPESATPQFAYTIIVDGTEVASDIDPKVRSRDITVFGKEVEVILEDILGRRTSSKTSVTSTSSNDSK